LGWCALLVTVLAACTHEEKRPEPAPPGPSYTGPSFLRNTVGSLARLSGYEPLLVSGFGIVADLHGSGSSDVPPFLQNWLINTMKREGVGSARVGLLPLSPEQLLATNDFAVVTIKGLIPPGAVRGTHFDVLVSALPKTQTTSLDGGQLWQADLSIDGDNPSLAFTKSQARGHGPVYVNPLDLQLHPDKAADLNRSGVVLGGGVAMVEQPLLLTLNQPSWTRSRLIADAINTRFHKDPAVDKLDTAVPETQNTIYLHIPRRYARNTPELVGLILHIFLQSTENFDTFESQRLGEVLVGNPKGTYDQDVTLAWIALGKTALPTIRKYYDDPNPRVRMAALEAGAKLEDELATDPLLRVAHLADPALRCRAAGLLVYLPRSLRASEGLQQLLRDGDKSVRIAAYVSLADSGDRIVTRIPIRGRDEVKFFLDIVPSDKPMIYVRQTDYPYIAVFGADTGFRTPLLARLWDNHVMIRGEGANQMLSVFFMPFVNYEVNPEASAVVKPYEGKTYRIAPAAANLIRLLASTPTAADLTEGFNLTYSHVVNALNTLHQPGCLDAEFEVQQSWLAEAIRKATEPTPMRPITAMTSDLSPATHPATAPGAGPGSATAAAPTTSASQASGNSSGGPVGGGDNPVRLPVP
jgi:flagellar basal body P-ring protein FlgI